MELCGGEVGSIITRRGHFGPSGMFCDNVLFLDLGVHHMDVFIF